MTDVTSTNAVPAIGISMSIDVSKGRNLVFQTHVEQARSQEHLNSVLDRLRLAADRMHAFYELDATQFQLDQERRLQETTLSNLVMLEERDTMARNDWVVSGRRGEWKRSEAEEKNRQAIASNIVRHKEMIATLEARIEDLKKQAA